MEKPTEYETPDEHIERVDREAEASPASTGSLPHEKKTTKGGVILVPQPSDDPHDPLVETPNNLVSWFNWLTCDRIGRSHTKCSSS
jgi:hypothetical protein